MTISNEEVVSQFWARIKASGLDAKEWAYIEYANSDTNPEEFLAYIGYEEPLDWEHLNTVAKLVDEVDPDGELTGDEVNSKVKDLIARRTNDTDLADRVEESIHHVEVFKGELKAAYLKFAAFFGYTNAIAANAWAGLATDSYLNALKQAEIKGRGGDLGYVIRAMRGRDGEKSNAFDEANDGLHRKAITEAWENTTAALEFEEPEHEFKNLAEMLAANPEPERYRVESLMTEGSTCAVVAKAKAGKTTLVMNLIKSLVDGTDFVGHEVTPVERNVCYWDLELTPNYQRTRFAKVGIENPEKVINRSMVGYNTALSTALGQNYAVKDLLEAEADVWVIDTFGAAFDGEDENHNSQVRKFFKGVDRVKRLAGVKEVFIIFHSGKGESSKARGASSVEDWAAVLWEYGGPKGKDVDTDDPTRRLHVYGRLEPTTVFVTYEDGVLRSTDAPVGANDAVASSKRQAVFDALLKAGESGMTQTGIRSATGMNPTTVKKHLTALIDENVIDSYEGAESGYLYYKVIDPSWIAGGLPPK